MSNKRLFFFLSLLVVFALALTACGGGNVPANEEPVNEEPVNEEPMNEEPVDEEPVDEEPMDETPMKAPGDPFWTAAERQALAAALDRESLVDRVFEGRNVPAYHMVPTGYPYATEPYLDKYGTRDLQMAIDLLTAEGYTEDNKFTFDLWYPPEHYGTTTADVMQVIKEQWEETGLIEVNLVVQNWAEYVDAFVDGNEIPIFILGWFPDLSLIHI